MKHLPKNYKLINYENETEINEENLKDIIRILRMNVENMERKEVIKLVNFFVSVGLHKLF